MGFGVFRAKYSFKPKLKLKHKWKRTLGVGLAWTPVRASVLVSSELLRPQPMIPYCAILWCRFFSGRSHSGFRSCQQWRWLKEVFSSWHEWFNSCRWWPIITDVLCEEGYQGPNPRRVFYWCLSKAIISKSNFFSFKLWRRGECVISFVVNTYEEIELFTFKEPSPKLNTPDATSSSSAGLGGESTLLVKRGKDLLCLLWLEWRWLC